MSLSNPTNTTTNPALRFFQWSGSQGNIKYYDKDKGENVFLDMPFKFIKLDTLATVTGYSDADDSGFWSNEVRSLKVEPLIVKTRNGVKKEGLWSEIGEALKAQGAKFASSVYIAYLNDNKELELANFKFFGASIKEWIDFTNENKIKDGDTVIIDGKNNAKKGSNKYFTPTFSKVETTETDRKEAIKLDTELQKYLTKYFDYSKADQSKVDSDQDTITDEDTSTEVDESDIPF